MRRKIPEPWAVWVYGPNRDKEVFASMADETKTNATPEAPGGPPPPAPEQTEQAVIPSTRSKIIPLVCGMMRKCRGWWSLSVPAV